MAGPGRRAAAAAISLEAMQPADWERVAGIYAAGIDGGDATFETEVPSWEEWDHAHLAAGRIVARAAGEVVGWAALLPVSRRPVYAGVAEHSVYVDPAWARRGVGRALLKELIRRAEEAGIWTLQTSIFPENEASLRLHAECGFRVVGRRERIGRHGVRGWRDTVLMERRSARAGRD